MDRKVVCMVDKAKRREGVEKYRQCPCCYKGDKNGVGTAYTSRNSKTYYKCDMCAHTWVVRREKSRTVVESTTRTVEESTEKATEEAPEKKSREAMNRVHNAIANGNPRTTKRHKRRQPKS